MSPCYPPAVIHSEYFHSGGAFRVGPVLPEFEDLMGRSIVETEVDEGHWSRQNG